ncbi:hypothetical protein [Burkholderia cepacia]
MANDKEIPAIGQQGSPVPPIIDLRAGEIEINVNFLASRQPSSAWCSE